MAKNPNDLFSALRDSGMRKKTARAAVDSADRANRGKPAKAVTKTIEGLRNAASELEDHALASSRSEAAKKGARTRKRRAAKRSEAAKKAAKTRARVS